VSWNSIQLKIFKFILKQARDINRSGYGELAFKFTLLNRLIFSSVHSILFFLYCKALYVFWLFPNAYDSAFAVYLQRHSTPRSPPNKSIYFYTLVWGPMVELYDKALMPSLFLDGNIPKLLKNGYSIHLGVFTQREDLDAVKSIIEKFLQTSGHKDQIEFNVEILNDRSYFIRDPMESLIEAIEFCLNNEMQFIVALPDFFFGNHSIHNLVAACSDSSSCIAAPHVRVDSDLFVEKLSVKNLEYENKTLAGLAHVIAHQNFANANSQAEMGTQYYSGMSYKEIDPKTFLIKHRLPNVFLANFTRSDLEYFKKHSFNNWDHAWPSKLMREGRYSLLGSTEFFLMVELTGAEEKHLPMKKRNGAAFDQYLPHQSLHKEINRCFYNVMSLNTLDSQKGYPNESSPESFENSDN
jgi:hypothetical protein